MLSNRSKDARVVLAHSFSGASSVDMLLDLFVIRPRVFLYYCIVLVNIIFFELNALHSHVIFTRVFYMKQSYVL